jgi:hypothetical protein
VAKPVQQRCLPAVTWKRPNRDAHSGASRLPALALPLLALACGCGQQDQTPPVATEQQGSVNGGREQPARALELTDIAGVCHRPFADPAVRAVALVFVLSDCPIANSYVPELNRLHAEYGPRGIRLFLIHVDPELGIEDARIHAGEYELQAPVVLDPRHALVRKTGATITPQAAVLSPAGDLLYLGRIDDRYVDLGKSRPKATIHDLRAAFDDILAGRTVSRPRTEAVGCPIPDAVDEQKPQKPGFSQKPGF